MPVVIHLSVSLFVRLSSLKWHICVCDFDIACHLLLWASSGGATNSLSHVLYVSISHSPYGALQNVNLYPISQPLKHSDISQSFNSCQFETWKCASISSYALEFVCKQYFKAKRLSLRRDHTVSVTGFIHSAVCCVKYQPWTWFIGHNITSHLLYRALGGGATNSLSHVLHGRLI